MGLYYAFQIAYYVLSNTPNSSLSCPNRAPVCSINWSTVTLQILFQTHIHTWIYYFINPVYIQETTLSVMFHWHNVANINAWLL